MVAQDTEVGPSGVVKACEVPIEEFTGEDTTCPTIWGIQAEEEEVVSKQTLLVRNSRVVQEDHTEVLATYQKPSKRKFIDVVEIKDFDQSIGSIAGETAWWCLS